MSAITTDPSAEIIRDIDEKNDYLWVQRGTAAPHLADLSYETLEKARNIEYTYGIGRAVLNASLAAFVLHNNYKKAFELLNESISIFTGLDEKKWIANTHATFAIIHNTLGNSEEAVYNILKALDYYENHDDETPDRVMLYYIAGTVYKDLKNYELAEKHYLHGIKWDSKESSNWSGRVFTGLSNVYAETDSFEKALHYSFIALDRLRSENNMIGESRALSDIGVIYKKQKDYTTALQYLNDGLKIRVDKNFKQFIISSHMEIAAVHNEAGNIPEAIESLEKGMAVALDIQQTAKLSRIYQDLANNYKLTGNFERVAHYLEKLLSVNTELHKKETENRIKNLHDAVVKEKEEEIERLKNVELRNAYDLITEKNKEITDSINYASRIQQGILPSPEDLADCFAQHFILYKPKDIVSGDFYWCKKAHPDRTDIDISVMAAVDCTGHGVPGAFMSMLGHTLLNQAIKSSEVTSPASALDYLNKELPHNLRSQDKQQSIKDGMDLVLCAVELKSKKLLFAGANNPLWIVRDKKVIEIAPDKQAISASDEIPKVPFTTKEFALQKNDMIYLFTDGYADQFGGPKGKKFKYSTLQQLLIDISHLPLQEQHQQLDTVFENWKGSLEQVDDVLIIGIRID